MKSDQTNQTAKLLQKIFTDILDNDFTQLRVNLENYYSSVNKELSEAGEELGADDIIPYVATHCASAMKGFNQEKQQQLASTLSIITKECHTKGLWGWLPNKLNHLSGGVKKAMSEKQHQPVQLTNIKPKELSECFFNAIYTELKETLDGLIEGYKQNSSIDSAWLDSYEYGNFQWLDEMFSNLDELRDVPQMLATFQQNIKTIDTFKQDHQNDGKVDLQWLQSLGNIKLFNLDNYELSHEQNGLISLFNQHQERLEKIELIEQRLTNNKQIDPEYFANPSFDPLQAFNAKVAEQTEQRLTHLQSIENEFAIYQKFSTSIQQLKSKYTNDETVDQRWLDGLGQFDQLNEKSFKLVRRQHSALNLDLPKFNEKITEIDTLKEKHKNNPAIDQQWLKGLGQFEQKINDEVLRQVSEQLSALQGLEGSYRLSRYNEMFDEINAINQFLNNNSADELSQTTPPYSPQNFTEAENKLKELEKSIELKQKLQVFKESLQCDIDYINEAYTILPDSYRTKLYLPTRLPREAGKFLVLKNKIDTEKAKVNNHLGSVIDSLKQGIGKYKGLIETGDQDSLTQQQLNIMKTLETQLNDEKASPLKKFKQAKATFTANESTLKQTSHPIIAAIVKGLFSIINKCTLGGLTYLFSGKWNIKSTCLTKQEADTTQIAKTFGG